MLSNKTCIVAGAGTGIGRAVAVELASAGANVVVNDLGTSLDGEGETDEPLEETVETIEENGGTALAHFGDISSFDYTERLVDDTLEEFGRIDGAVNFAGILRDSISYKMTPEMWDDVVRVHLRGHFALFRNVAAHWREVAREEDDYLDQSRSFVSVSSRSALGKIGQINYSSAKAGILGMTRTGARELDRYNVRVNAIVPSAYTRMLETVPEEKRSYTREDMPPERIGAIVTYLMSDEAEGITGQTFRAGGDGVGIIKDPEIHRLGFNEGGWTAEDIAERFWDSVGEDVDKKNLERAGGSL
ncbi:SDR family oxidoreductase [Natrarchaeobius oligotrophus]|uniref:SDR family oxidoreductase n=1 Tax=Natrarchaeobius chitinivorans TaxID=1679083 RepID=A0A3N6N151_NATCH|nr:SDR family oxidoreductase [Natrarchaeobius chitinivorans]RQH02582.1 SDR family oxidoreductase [Natrarchaeobius chitinivorans]